MDKLAGFRKMIKNVFQLCVDLTTWRSRFSWFTRNIEKTE